ncbi:MAG: Gfo/Idh/MocA family oxidoreductase, partial [Bacteroidota bacterium]|nr:Gfo/Idh/MocA family oxidoreductase [Bacteroidota bacterium]
MHRKTKVNRRDFIRSTAKGAVAGSLLLGAFPTIVPASVLGRNAPSNRINIAALGNGRISRSHDMPNVLKYDTARIIAVADVDSKRVNDAKMMVNDFYSKKEGKNYDGVRTYGDYREALLNKDVDAVIISTPDHWHALMAVHAVEAGKDVYMQKPTSLTIEEGRVVSNAVHRSGRILQIGTQQRSSAQFRYACELVRNGRIGDLHSVEVGLPGDPAGDEEPEMPIPPNLDYEMWLGSTPYVYYTEKRVHPQNNYDRPGWLRCEQFGAGMITGWGQHH